jgi:Fe-Mn family superoxide dismutase
MSKKNNRREFVKNVTKTAAAFYIGLPMIKNFIPTVQKSDLINNIQTGFDQKPLPYKYNALEDVIDALTMEIHYSKHAATYSKNLIEAATAEHINMQYSLENVLSNVSKFSNKIRNNGGGHFNHEMFWQCMQPKTENNKPSDKLLKEIEVHFGSFTEFKTKFSDTAKSRFGSGWAWLYLDKENKLKIGSTANQDNPLMDIATIEHKGFPLLCLDVWEHAYYLKYQNKRADYIENWWKLVNWNYVEQRLDGSK